MALRLLAAALASFLAHAMRSRCPGEPAAPPPPFVPDQGLAHPDERTGRRR
jgi:hypothetical protein